MPGAPPLPMNRSTRPRSVPHRSPAVILIPPQPSLFRSKWRRQPMQTTLQPMPPRRTRQPGNQPRALANDDDATLCSRRCDAGVHPIAVGHEIRELDLPCGSGWVHDSTDTFREGFFQICVVSILTTPVPSPLVHANSEWYKWSSMASWIWWNVVAKDSDGCWWCGEAAR